MQDEPEPEEPPVPPDPSAERMIHQRARFYRRAKSVLDAADADPSEKSMGLVTLHRLWEEGYTIAAPVSYTHLFCEDIRQAQQPEMTM